MSELGLPQFGMCLLPVIVLPAPWQTIAATLDPEAEEVWVVFWEGEIFGVYLSSPEAAGAVASIEADIAAKRRPKRQTIEQVRLQKHLEELKKVEEAQEAQKALEAKKAQQVQKSQDNSSTEWKP